MAQPSLRLACPHCSHTLRAPEEARGRRVRCPACGEAFDVPRHDEGAAEAGGRKARCLCGHLILLSDATPGTMVRCPACRRRLTVPGAPPGASPAPSPASAAARPTPSAAPGEGLACPKCGKLALADAILCTDCGTNLKTGRRLLTKFRGNVGLEADEIRSWVNGVSLILPFAIVPYKTTAKQGTSRLANTILVAATSAISLVALVALIGGNEGVLEWALWPGEKFAFLQLLTHIFLHGGLAHLVGNMLFLWMFGGAISSAVGWQWYSGLYLALGALAGYFGHVAFAPDGPPVPLVGASGAICGLTGIYLVLFPRHDVHMAIWFRIAWWIRPWIKTFPLTGIYAVLFFTAFDVAALALGWTGSVANAVHIAGFLSGIVIGLVLLLTGLVKSEGYDLLSWILGDRWRPLGA